MDGEFSKLENMQNYDKKLQEFDDSCQKDFNLQIAHVIVEF